MSILQEYREIRNKIGEEKYNLIQEFLKEYPHYFLSDIYYSESVWNEFEEWTKRK